MDKNKAHQNYDPTHLVSKYIKIMLGLIFAILIGCCFWNIVKQNQNQKNEISILKDRFYELGQKVDSIKQYINDEELIECQKKISKNVQDLDSLRLYNSKNILNLVDASKLSNANSDYKNLRNTLKSIKYSLKPKLERSRKTPRLNSREIHPNSFYNITYKNGKCFIGECLPYKIEGNNIFHFEDSLIKNKNVTYAFNVNYNKEHSPNDYMVYCYIIKGTSRNITPLDSVRLKESGVCQFNNFLKNYENVVDEKSIKLIFRSCYIPNLIWQENIKGTDLNMIFH